VAYDSVKPTYEPYRFQKRPLLVNILHQMKLANIVTVSVRKTHFNITLSSTSKCAIWILCLFAGTGWRNGVQSRAKTSLTACVGVSSGEQFALHFAGLWYFRRSGNDSRNGTVSNPRILESLAVHHLDGFGIQPMSYWIGTAACFPD